VSSRNRLVVCWASRGDLARERADRDPAPAAAPELMLTIMSGAPAAPARSESSAVAGAGRVALARGRMPRA